jgi:SAM-dependent methyltransferase
MSHKTLIETQYNKWVYPEPITDLAAWAANFCQICDPSLHHPLIWPDQLYNPAISILVAGCGTSQAAILAYTNPKAAVIGIDISATSLEHAARLKAKHNLVNLQLLQMDLHDAPTLRRAFDLVYATGVLHHLDAPEKGLAALTSVIGDHGVLCAMLYAKYARAAIYQLQEALRRMNVEQTADGVAFVRNVIDALPPRHPAQSYIKGATRDLSFDAGIVDTFLHREDHAFAVPDILALARTCGLTFQGWVDNLYYYPDGAFPIDHPLYKRIASLPEEDQWAVIELLTQPSGIHSFLLRRDTEPREKFRIDFDNPASCEWIPGWRHLLQVIDEGGMLTLKRAGYTTRINELERDLFLAIDAIATCGSIIKNYGRSSPNIDDQARRLFTRLWRLGHITFSRCPGRYGAASHPATARG